MANPYFTRPASVTSGTVIRSDKYNSDLDTQESAFNALHDKLQHAVFLPETFSGNPNIPEQTVNDTFIYIDTSGNIALYPIATILEQFELVEQRYYQIEAWQAQVAEDAIKAQESATLSQRFANENEDVEVLSGLYSAKHWAKHAEAQIPLIQAAGQAKVDLAQGYANANKNVEVEAGFYSAKHYSLVAADQIPLVEAAGQAKVDAAQGKVDEAQTKVTLAQNYANAAKSVQVEPGFFSAKHYSIIAQEQLAIVQAAGQEKVDDAATQVSLATTQAGNATTQANNASASATKADNFANYAHNQFVPNSGGKYSSYHWAKEAEAYAQQTLSTVNGNFVPNTRTVNGKALSSNIIIGTADIQGLSTVATSGSYADLNNIPTDLLKTANNLSDLTNKSTARGNLGLGSAATKDVTTSATDTTNGRVLKVGDFGLGGDAPDFSGNIDDNTLGGGVYYVTGTATGTKPNSSSAFGYLTVSKEDPVGITASQQWRDNGSNRTFVRHYFVDSWSDWQELYHTGNQDKVGELEYRERLTTASTLEANKQYDLRNSVTYTLPLTTGLAAGASIKVTKGVSDTPTIQRNTGSSGSIIIGRDSGSNVTDTSITFDINSELVLIWNGSNWEV